MKEGYDSFAEIYDKFWGERSLAFVPLVQDKLLVAMEPGSQGAIFSTYVVARDSLLPA